MLEKITQFIEDQRHTCTVIYFGITDLSGAAHIKAP